MLASIILAVVFQYQEMSGQERSMAQKVRAKELAFFPSQSEEERASVKLVCWLSLHLLLMLYRVLTIEIWVLLNYCISANSFPWIPWQASTTAYCSKTSFQSSVLAYYYSEMGLWYIISNICRNYSRFNKYTQLVQLVSSFLSFLTFSKMSSFYELLSSFSLSFYRLTLSNMYKVEFLPLLFSRFFVAFLSSSQSLEIYFQITPVSFVTALFHLVYSALSSALILSIRSDIAKKSQLCFCNSSQYLVIKVSCLSCNPFSGIKEMRQMKPLQARMMSRYPIIMACSEKYFTTVVSQVYYQKVPLEADFFQIQCNYKALLQTNRQQGLYFSSQPWSILTYYLDQVLISFLLPERTMFQARQTPIRPTNNSNFIFKARYIQQISIFIIRV